MTQSAPPTLDTLRPGKTGIITRLNSQGLERRRMLDMGLLPGTHVTMELVSPGGDPHAYWVRGALIALRNDQARLIEIDPRADGAERSTDQ